MEAEIRAGSVTDEFMSRLRLRIKKRRGGYCRAGLTEGAGSAELEIGGLLCWKSVSRPLFDWTSPPFATALA